ncbi:MAG TPA: SDR family oxidoreductase [Jatrophihabitantaceae bacterium]|jgi:NADP-dependent 3-hydroxy acid dehydrogenase YdfG|nr:SDR family oxidoreductase [Jatrophihabitantaceae bacterium]
MSRRFPPHPERRPAVVAGASSGIGAATAVALGAAGFPVAVGARRLDRCEKVAAQIREAGGEAVAHTLDVTSEVSVTEFARAVTDELGDVDVVIANAGTIVPAPILRADTAAIAAEIDVSILGAHRLLRAFVPGMVERAHGDFVVVSSDVVPNPRPGVAGYVSGKWGLEGLATVARMELEGTGVRVCMVRPGPTFTEIASEWDPEQVIAVVESWKAFGLARHTGFLLDVHMAQAILNVVSMPKGSYLSVVEVQPEAPVERSEKSGKPS